MQNGTKFPGIPMGIFLKTYSQEFLGIPEREFPVALLFTLCYNASICIENKEEQGT